MTKQAVYIPDQSWYLHLAKFKAVLVCLGFPSSSAGKESTCNAGHQGSIPGLSRSPGEGIGYPLQYSWASLVVQMVKNPPAVWEAWVWSLGLKDPLEEGMATSSSILAWRIPIDRGAWQATFHEVTESDTTEWLSTLVPLWALVSPQALASHWRNEAASKSTWVEH